MSNRKQVAILKKGFEAWNTWAFQHRDDVIDLTGVRLARADLKGFDFRGVHLARANFEGADLQDANFERAHLAKACFKSADLWNADFRDADLSGANLSDALLTESHLANANLNEVELNNASLQAANLEEANLRDAILDGASLRDASLERAIFIQTSVDQTGFVDANIGGTIFAYTDLSHALYLDKVHHNGPSIIDEATILMSKGQIPEIFLRGCGLSDIQIEFAKLLNPELTNEEIVEIQYRIYDLRAMRSIQIHPLFISYSHADSEFVDKIESYLNENGIRFWRDIHDMKSGRMEKQIDRAIRQNPTVLVVLSKNSFQSDWVEHEVRTARGLEKEMNRDVLCPVALDETWKKSPWAKRIMEQVLEYNILDFSSWRDDTKLRRTFNKLIDGLELFYK